MSEEEEIGTPEEIDDDAPFTPDALERWNAQARAESLADDKEQEEQLRRAMRADGTFKSLAHKLQYLNGEVPQTIIGGPKAEDYGPDDDGLFEADRRAYLQTGRLANGLSPVADDPHRASRDDRKAQVKEWGRKQALAAYRGDADGVDRAKFHSRMVIKDLETSPEEPVVTRNKELYEANRVQSLELAFSDDTAHESFWDTPRMKNDGAILAAEHITQGGTDTIYLPEETSRGSYNFKPFHPKTDKV